MKRPARNGRCALAILAFVPEQKKTTISTLCVKMVRGKFVLKEMLSIKLLLFNFIEMLFKHVLL